MSEFKKYRRTNIAEMRDFTDTEINSGLVGVSVSDEDNKLPHFEFIKGKVARNPENHKDQWYVSREYFLGNFESV